MNLSLPLGQNIVDDVTVASDDLRFRFHLRASLDDCAKYFPAAQVYRCNNKASGKRPSAEAKTDHRFCRLCYGFQKWKM